MYHQYHSTPPPPPPPPPPLSAVHQASPHPISHETNHPYQLPAQQRQRYDSGESHLPFNTQAYDENQYHLHQQYHQNMPTSSTQPLMMTQQRMRHPSFPPDMPMQMQVPQPQLGPPPQLGPQPQLGLHPPALSAMPEYAPFQPHQRMTSENILPTPHHFPPPPLVPAPHGLPLPEIIHHTQPYIPLHDPHHVIPDYATPPPIVQSSNHHIHQMANEEHEQYSNFHPEYHISPFQRQQQQRGVHHTLSSPHHNQQRTPKQKRFYSNQPSPFQSQVVNTDRLKEESSPFRYNYNRRSSIVSNSGSTVQNHSRSSRKQSISVRRGGISKELQSTPHMAVSGSGVQEEKEWNKIGSGSTEGEDDETFTRSTSNPVLSPQTQETSNHHQQHQQPYMLYQPCMNPSCPNIYHYTQQIYQPVADPHTSGLMALVEIPGIIQAPAWCELKPCGCTLCRECFTSVIATCEISYPVPPPSSSNSAPNGQTASIPASSNIHEAQKKFNCVVCRASCTEFGPINGELQDVVESAKAADAQYVNDHATATGGGIILRQDEVDKIEGPITTVIRDFDGFQSAQDIALGKIKYPNPKLNPDDGTSGSVSCSSTVSPLLRPELSETLNRRAKSDSALSLPHSPLFFHAENAGDQSIPTSEIKDLTNSVGSLHFPSLQRMENVTVPSRKVSNTTSVSISTTATLESPQAYSTPDLAAWSASSSASASSAPSSPVTMQSPILAMRFADTTLKEVPWRHEAVPTHYEKGNMPEKNAHVVDSKKTSTQVATTQNEKKDQGSVGLGLTFGSVPPSASSEAAAGTLSARIQSQPDQKAISSKPVSREGSVSPANNKKSKSKNKDPTGINVSTAASLMSAENVHKYDDKGQSPATPHRNTRPDAHVTPSRSLRGRGRGRGGSVRGGATGGGGYIAAHQARMAQVAQQSSPLKPSANFSFNPIHSRTSTQSSITNTTSSPASSRGSSWTFHPHGRKVSKAENRSSILPDYLANPTQEQISIWEDNKSKWWIDPWLGKPMGVRERLIDGTKVTCASDGKPLTRGKAAGISWPVLKIHNISFSTTIMDIESFVPPRVLAPLEYNAQGVHLICDLADGKTRPYAYVECISVEAAEQLIREADAQYLAGRQVAFRPVTQKEPALDLFPSLRKGGYHRDVIVRSSPSKAGLSRGYAHTHGSDEAGMELELFTEEHYQQFKVLFDMALGPPARDSQTAINEPHLQQEHANSSLFYSFPPERPFARLVSMIVKYPCHAKKNTSNHSTQEYNQEIDCLLRCSLYALDKLAPHVKSRPQLRSVAERLNRAVLQCPAFDEPRRADFLAKWNSIM